MMSGVVVYGLSSAEQLSSCDRMERRRRKKKRSDGTEKNVRNDADEEKEKLWNGDKKKKKKAGRDAGQREKKMLIGNKKAKNRKVCSAFFEKERKKKMLSSQNGEKKMNNDEDMVKKMKMSVLVDRSKMEKDETDNRTLSNIPVAKEMKMQPSDSVEMKKKKQDTPFVHTEKITTHTFSTDSKEKKRKAPSTPFVREQKMRADDKGKKVHSDGKTKETKKARSDANGNEENICIDGKKKKRKAPFAFFKFMCNNFKKFLSIPPMVAPNFEDLINRYVYLKDSEGKYSNIRLSVVDGSLAFYQGWNNFVSEHFIKWGDFLLFEYTAESTFFVRVFGRDSCEILHFNVESGRVGPGKKKIESNTPTNDLVSRYKGQDSEDIDDGPYVSREYPKHKEPKITLNAEIIPSNLVAESTDAAASATQDPERVESRIVHGSLGALDNQDMNLDNGECQTKSVSLLSIQEKTRKSKVIIITDASSSTQENEDTVKQTISSAASETHQETINTKKDPEIVADSVWCESSMFIGECKNKNASPTCSKGETKGSKTILITDATPLTQENINVVKLTTFSHLKEDRNMTREPSHAATTTTTKCTEMHDSDEDLRRNHQRNTFQAKSTIAVDKYPNNNGMKNSGNFTGIYITPESNRLEKWKKGSVSGQAALHGIGQIRPETTQNVSGKLVGDCGAMELNPVDPWLGSDGTDTCLQPMLTMPIEKPSFFDRMPVSKCELRTEISHFANKKGTTVQLQTKKEQLEPTGSSGSRQGDKIPMHADHVLVRKSEQEIIQQENGKFTSCVNPVAVLPVQAEILESDNCSLQFFIPPITRTWLELPKPLWSVVPQKGRQTRHDRIVIILKDPMKRLWPVFYHENPIFLGFTAGWKPFARANNLQAGDVCALLKELDQDVPTYQAQITRK
ncbi:hypothetical protein GUJ93_ZPchr0006g45405 [Zizania palustris]|uniref:TF-B3 domain-containing protein n=1 Tax=Zizania palustris TaxID=103762 RepID=A0A8J5SR37_ZIZPA|nr:hypothetical protein GUJ93_ZPchr0006g45405 [Zizania palustris]